VIFWDKEEIGSEGATGAASRFFEYCVENLLPGTAPVNSASEVFLNSRALSADVQAALDPDFQDLHEKQNAARLGYGPCFSKFTGSRGKYGASEADAEYFASLRGLLNAKDIPWQSAELGKVDQGGGGTVALFLAAYGMQVIDFGPPVLSMHSPCELASCADLWFTVEAYKAFFES
jgi:aspartyl aminopeptidase